MKKALICHRWEMAFQESLSEPAEKTAVASEPFVDRIFGARLKDISASTAAGYELLKDLPPDCRVTEFFGGVGLQTKMVQALLSPSFHIVMEKDERCLAHLVRTFPAAVYTRSAERLRSARPAPSPMICRGDARQVIEAGNFAPADIYLLDWNTFTIHQWKTWAAPLVEQLFRTHPLALTWYDTSRPYFHLHKALYSAILGTVSNLHEYSLALSTFFHSRYGYSVTRAIYCPRATYYRLEPTVAEQPPVEITITYENDGFLWTDSA